MRVGLLILLKKPQVNGKESLWCEMIKVFLKIEI
jgi:hypothetical protein